MKASTRISKTNKQISKAGKSPARKAKVNSPGPVSPAAKGMATRMAARELFEVAKRMELSLNRQGDVCIQLGSKPGYIRICKIDRTGACTDECKEVPDKGGQILGFVISV